MNKNHQVEFNSLYKNLALVTLTFLIILNLVILISDFSIVIVIPVLFQSAILVSILKKCVVSRVLMKVWSGLLVIGSGLKLVVIAMKSVSAGAASVMAASESAPVIDIVTRSVLIGVGILFFAYTDRCIVVGHKAGEVTTEESSAGATGESRE